MESEMNKDNISNEICDTNISDRSSEASSNGGNGSSSGSSDSEAPPITDSDRKEDFEVIRKILIKHNLLKTEKEFIEEVDDTYYNNLTPLLDVTHENIVKGVYQSEYLKFYDFIGATLDDYKISLGQLLYPMLRVVYGKFLITDLRALGKAFVAQFKVDMGNFCREDLNALMQVQTEHELKLSPGCFDVSLPACAYKTLMHYLQSSDIMRDFLEEYFKITVTEGASNIEDLQLIDSMMSVLHLCNSTNRVYNGPSKDCTEHSMLDELAIENQETGVLGDVLKINENSPPIGRIEYPVENEVGFSFHQHTQHSKESE